VSELQSIIESLQELQRMHELNLELLEQLGIFADWIVANEISIPNKEKLESLIHKTQALLIELQSDSPKTLIYHGIRRKVTDEENRQRGNRTAERNINKWLGNDNMLLLPREVID
jgi:hypothetical protein